MFVIFKKAKQKDIKINNFNKYNEQSNYREDISLSDFSSKIFFCQKEIKNIEIQINEILYLKNLVINSNYKEERDLA